MTTPEKTPHLYRIFSSPEEINQQVDSALVEGLSAHFPIESKQYRLEAQNFHAEPKQFSMKDEKDAILRSKSLTYPIKADLKLIDKSTGEVVAEAKGFSLMDSFGLTSKHTVVYKGNNYSISNQLQLRPGVYTRSRETGELESHFNTGTGRSFSLTLDPQTGLFYVNVGSSNILASPLISKVFGVGVTEASKYVPKEVWNDNLAAASGKETKILGDLYKRLVSTSKQQAGASQEVMAVQLKESLLNSQLSTQTTAETLGKPLGSVTHDAILLAMRNLIEVHARRRPEDNRDSLQFKRVQNLPDFLRTRFNKEHQVVRSVKTKIARDMDRMPKGETSMRNILASKPFNKFFSNYLVNSNLASTPSETNPIESIENVAKVTVLGAGEGGISDERAVPMSARDIDPSHLGIIDPSRTPESGHAGIDQRFTVTARRDAEGNLYARVKDNSGAVKYLNVQQMVNSVIGFPGQDGKDPVQAQIRGNLGQCKRSEVNYWLGDVTDMYTVTTNLVPFLNSNHPGRLTMAGKAIPQALSLVDREAPLVQTTNDRNMSLVKGIGQVISTKSPVDGVVTEASGRTVKIKDEAGRLHKVEGVKNLPFNMKGFLDDEKLLVKEGDKVSMGTPIFDNNYTQNGVLSLGKNLNVAYIPYKGYNHEDGLVLRQGAADKLGSHHACKIDYAVQETSVMKKSLIQRYFPGRFTKEQLEKLDDHGFAKVGSKLAHGDPVYIVLERRTLTPEDKMLGRLHKSLVNPYRPAVEYWTHEEVGEVVDAHTESKDVRILVRSIKPLDIGDKLTGLHGNKGIVSLILPDEKMPYSAATGKPVDILLNPASVTSRVNLGQLMETAAGKIAQHTGTPYLVHNFSKESNVKNLSEELAKHGLSDSEELIDPTTGKSMPKVLTGPQYFLKLYKTSDQNWSARNVGSYDNTLQPTKGGEEGSKSVGFMEMLGLLGSDARHNLKEIATLKAQENTEYWSKFLKGQPLPKPNTTFATQKFLDYLTGAGIKTSINNGKITISPMTDRDVLSISHGEIKTPSMLSAKDLEPERGGLFDPVLTGGLRGTKWTHYKLAEAIPHPVMEKPIKSVLGLSTKEFEGIAGGSLAVNRVSRGVFNLHDVSTGKVVKTVNISDVKLEEPEIENDHHD